MSIWPWDKEGHAVFQAGFAVDFSSNPTPQTIRDLLSLHSKLARNYPRKRETTGRIFGISADLEAEELLSKVGSPELAGFIFDSLYSNGNVERSITLNDNTLSITRADYHGWKTTWPEVREIFAMMLPILMERSDMAAVKIQYDNRFVWTKGAAEFRAANLFREDSDVLVRNAFGATDLWHSYHGFFEYPVAPAKHQLLNVIEAQVKLPGQVTWLEEISLVVDVRTRQRAVAGCERAGMPGKPLETVPEALGETGVDGALDAYMNEMHDAGKLLLARLINDDMCEKIGVDRPE